MKTIQLQGDGVELAFPACKALADAVATELLGEMICLAWYDQAKDQECPAHVSECHDACDIPGYIEYAETRGGELRIVCGDGDFVFCYRPAGEFAELAGQTPRRESTSSPTDADTYDWPRGG